MKRNMFGQPLNGPTYAVPNVVCRKEYAGADGPSLFCMRRGHDGPWKLIPAWAISEDSEVLRWSDEGTLVLLESAARECGWVDEGQTEAAREARKLADAVSERRVDKLPCTRGGAETALSLTFQVWQEWQDPSPDPHRPGSITAGSLDDKTRPEVEHLFLSWVRGLMADILAECMPNAPTGSGGLAETTAGAMQVDATDAEQVRAAVLAGGPDARSHRTEERGRDDEEGDLRIDHMALVPRARRTFEAKVVLGSRILLGVDDTPNTKLGPYRFASLAGDYVEDTPDGLSTLRRASGQPVMVMATAALEASPNAGQCPWCTACYSTRDELLRHLDAVGRHEGARLVEAEARVATLTGTLEELQAVIDTYGESGASVVVKAGEEGEVDVWSDGHAHAFAPLSTLRAVREELAVVRTQLEAAEKRAEDALNRASIAENIIKVTLWKHSQGML